MITIHPRRLPQNADSLQQVRTILALALAQSHANTFAQGLQGLPAGHRTLFADSDLQARRDWASTLKPDVRRSITAHLDRAEELGPTRRVARAPRPAVYQALNRDFPHFHAVTAHLQQRAALSRLGATQHLRLDPILLSGDPGVGKTAYAQAAAELIGVPFIKVDVGATGSAFALAGLDVGYDTGKPGLIWDVLQDECMSPVLLLDELDKLGLDTRESHLGPLYGLLEPVTATKFSDAAIGLPIDASCVCWLATCNDEDRIEPALRSRFKRFEVPMPTRTQMRAVVSSIQRHIRRTEEWAAGFPAEPSEDVTIRLCAMSPRQARQSLTDAYATAAMDERRSLRASDVHLPSEESTSTMGFLSNQ
jgi:ATP-dependent Lon protease